MRKHILATMLMGVLTVVSTSCNKDGSNTPNNQSDANSVSNAQSNDAGNPDASNDCAKFQGQCIDAGSIVTFGNYPQATNDPEPLQWRVLEIDSTKQKVFLLSEYVIDVKPYEAIKKSVTWETCSLRAWLNSDFMDAAFSADEKQRIVTTHLTNPDNAFNGTSGGNDTDDNVFLLSLDDARNPAYFTKGAEITGIPLSEATDPLPNQSARDARTAKATTYAVNKNVLNTSPDECANVACSTQWWLRSPGYDESYGAHVGAWGDAPDDGRRANNDRLGVRPALWVKY